MLKPEKIVLVNGRLIDPENNRDGIYHVVISDGKIQAIYDCQPVLSADIHLIDVKRNGLFRD